MKKFFAVLTVLCLVLSMAAMAEKVTVFTFRNDVVFGMPQKDVVAAEGNAPHEVETEHTLGPVTFTEVEYENVAIDNIKADVKYMFVEDALVAIRVNYDDGAVSYDEIDKTLTAAYGEGADLDVKALGNGVYAVDDEGRPEAKAKLWNGGDVLVVVEQDEDDVDVTYLDAVAAYLK
ncbi:MAG: hypothetical protein IJH25_11070 [Clostridia bacterium]|nr:hypothetical protein [Clostridia bacterium]MBQ6120810.1 hypothetical protein [Clostridia bacterium]